MNNQHEVSIATINCRIDEVKQEFKDKFDLEVEVVFHRKNHIKDCPNLDELETCANIVLKARTGSEFPDKGIRSKSRETEVISCRHIFNYLAYSYGYKLSAVGRFMDLDHATIISSKMRAAKLMEAKDAIVMTTYRAILSEINQFMAHKLNKEGNGSV